MDASKDYIEMIDKSNLNGNDKDGWVIPLPGDFFISRYIYEIGQKEKWKEYRLQILFDYRIQGLFTCTTDTGKDFIKVYRQDQLQDIYGATWIDFVCKFYDFVTQKDGDDFPTKEQAILAFVMHEKYDKKWNGKDWISES